MSDRYDLRLFQIRQSPNVAVQAHVEILADSSQSERARRLYDYLPEERAMVLSALAAYDLERSGR
jgi:hypothetical protein